MSGFTGGWTSGQAKNNEATTLPENAAWAKAQQAMASIQANKPSYSQTATTSTGGWLSSTGPIQQQPAPEIRKSTYTTRPTIPNQVPGVIPGMPPIGPMGLPPMGWPPITALPTGAFNTIGMPNRFPVQQHRATYNARQILNRYRQPNLQGQIPPGFRAYTERAIAATTSDEEKAEVEKKLKERLQPLLHSGMAWKINWDTELLPTDPNYKAGGWVPATIHKPTQAKTPQTQSKNRHGLQDRIGAHKANGNNQPLGRHKRSRLSESHSENFESKNSGRSRSPTPMSTGINDWQPVTPVINHLQNRLGKNKNNKKNQKQNQQQKQFATSGNDIPISAAPTKKMKTPGGAFSIKNTIETARQRARRAERFAPQLAANELPRNFGNRRNRIDYDDDSSFYIDSGPTSSSTEDTIDLSQFKIVGTSNQIEKQYLRLTTAPDPSQVRPPPILRIALQNIQEKYSNDESNYRYACDQLKSIRQDLTVQGVRDELTVEVYETHARIALEKGDMNEFNQCQTQLTALHTLLNSKNKYEFTAYRLLYSIALNDGSSIMKIISELHLTPVLKAEADDDECIKYALQVRRAWNTNNYSRLFKLLTDTQNAPRMCTYVCDWFTVRYRVKGLATMCEAFRPTLPVTYASKQLGFRDQTGGACLQWLRKLDLPLKIVATKQEEGKEKREWHIDCKEVKLDMLKEQKPTEAASV